MASRPSSRHSTVWANPPRSLSIIPPRSPSIAAIACRRRSRQTLATRFHHAFDDGYVSLPSIWPSTRIVADPVTAAQERTADPPQRHPAHHVYGLLVASTPITSPWTRRPVMATPR